MAESKKLHIVMFPWLAFGHMIPYLELAKLIAQKGHRVSFVSTPRNIDRLPKLLPNLLPFITFVKIPLPRHDGNLPEGAEATSDVPYEMVQHLNNAYDALEEPLSNFLQASEPDWFLHDFVSYWAGPMAARVGVPCAFFSIFIPAVLGFLGPPSVLWDGIDDRSTPEEYTVSPKWVPFPSTVAYRYYEVKKIFDQMSPDDTGVSTMQRFGGSLRRCDIILMRSCAEFDKEWLQVMEEINKKPVLPVGELPTTTSNEEDDANTDIWHSTKAWLDNQPKRSVVYVAFGSEAKPTQEELTQIALGLELSGLPFFWVLRNRRGFADTVVVELPDGFEERTKGRGVICTSWVPQLKILTHESVGGILTHAGWSTVVEGFVCERALIMLPFLADQGLNARVLEEKKLGYSIPRNERDGFFTAKSVAESLRLVMVGEEGKIYRDNAKEMSGLFGDRNRQERYVDNLLDYLGTHKFANKAWEANGASETNGVGKYGQVVF